MLMKALTFLEAKNKIENWCAYQERCHQEVQNKLMSFGLSIDEVDRLVAHLISNNYLNEQRYAQAVFSGKHRIKKWGRLKIEQFLKQKAVPDVIIQSAVNEVPREEYFSNLSNISKKYINIKGLSMDSFKDKTKLVKYLQQKGYTYQEITICFEDLSFR